ncbi:DUF2004 domain-containing protein [Persicirhabdus sediminis]|uniref:DUF2004 domain-containing protein n=1 Tax=Persicirhabdus sediminis TaxID=454144 RepID=A0A8J7MCV1_9BACT|nr:DUF2004 domain-containing protein [Persicirhabdus sediminis]MBK1790997.1 DUF2004 domain-containing protein [Persicirhabdus sediminis]
MPIHQDTIDKFSSIALSAIKAAYGTEDDEYGSTLFVAHHLEELEASYWQSHFKVDVPEASQILDSLVLSPYCIDEEDEVINNLDFTLPGEVTNYLICVCFEGDEVIDITMES